MEEDNLEMGMFDSGFELNTDFSIDHEAFEDTEENEITDEDQGLDDPNKETTVEDESSEEVDSEEDDTDEGSEDSDSSSTLYSSLAAVIHEQGLLPSLNIDVDKIETIDDFVNAFKKEQEIQANAKLDEYIANIDVNQIAQSKQMIQSLESVTEDVLREDIELAKQLIYSDYINQGLDEKKATRLLTRLIDLGDEAILEDAQDSLESLKEYEARKIEYEKESYMQRLEESKAEQAKMDEYVKNTIYNTKEPLTGFTPTKALQDQVYKSITEIVGKSPDGVFENRFMRDRRENPIEFETRMYFLYELTNGFKDYSKLATSAKSSAVKDLEKIARRTKIKDNGTPTWMQDNDSYDNIGSVLNI
jgi:hypothetical protein